MEPRISIITLGVSNLQKSTEFYRDGLGLPEQKGNDGITFFELSGTKLALFPKDKLARDANVKNVSTGFPGFTLAHNVSSKKKVDELMKKAEKIGAEITDPAHEREWGGYSGYFKDPDGYLWEIAYNPYFKL